MPCFDFIKKDGKILLWMASSESCWVELQWKGDDLVVTDMSDPVKDFDMMEDGDICTSEIMRRAAKCLLKEESS